MYVCMYVYVATCVLVYMYVCTQINLVHPMYSNVTMKSLTDCELFVITREALSEILIFYPEGKLYMSIYMYMLCGTGQG